MICLVTLLIVLHDTAVLGTGDSTPMPIQMKHAQGAGGGEGIHANKMEFKVLRPRSYQHHPYGTPESKASRFENSSSGARHSSSLLAS